MKKEDTRTSRSDSGLTAAAGEEYKTVMVVEDDQTHRKFMDEILKDCGFHTILAENGLVALAHLEIGQKIDLILMDWDMPKMNGLETVRRIRERQVNEFLPHIPVIAFTGHRMPGDREKCLAAGMDAYLPKAVWMPKWRQTLVNNLQDLLTGDFDPESFEDEEKRTSVIPSPANFNLDEFNMGILKETKALLKGSFVETVNEYLEDATAYIAGISQGLAENDKTKVAKSSHPLKSNSKGFGLMAVAALAETINLAALKAIESGGTLDSAHNLLPQLLEAFERAEKKLRLQI
jgi:CheY-like chemotaxis protein